MKSTMGVSLPIASRESNHAHVGHADRLVPVPGHLLLESLDNGLGRYSASTGNADTYPSCPYGERRSFTPNRSVCATGVRLRVRNPSLKLNCQ